jgi:hypothetical protein
MSLIPFTELAELSGERWMPLVGHEWGYEVSDLGRVRSIDRRDRLGRLYRGRILKPCPTVSGYLEVFPCLNGVSKPVLIHRAVLEAFVGQCPEGMEGCHENGNNADNRLANLRWDTRSNNHADKVKHGTDARGEKNSQSKLTADEVIKIRKMRDAGLTLRAIGGKYGVSEGHVCSIAGGKLWRHL